MNPPKKCAMRTLVLMRPGFAYVITQDIRRKRHQVTGHFAVGFAPGGERVTARRLGCAFVARIKP